MPRFILAEMNTHRVFSRNSASSRAIPVAKQLERIERDPFVPKAFPVNRPGMSATEYVTHGNEYENRKMVWLLARDKALAGAGVLLDLGVHKQIANRLLEPFMWHTVIVSSTEWQNFWDLRISEFAQPEIKETAEAMRDAMSHSTPFPMDEDGWHLPLVTEDDWELDLIDKIKCSVARCAAVSYDRHLDRDVDKEMTRYDLLAGNGHFSPFEHAARPNGDGATWANFRGWQQARWWIERGRAVLC